MQALRSSEHRSERFRGGPHDVVVGLLRGEADAGRLGVELEHPGAFLGCLVPLSHPASPDPAGGPELGDLLEEVDMRVEEEAEAGGEVVDVETTPEAELDVGEARR